MTQYEFESAVQYRRQALTREAAQRRLAKDTQPPRRRISLAGGMTQFILALVR